MKCSCCGKPLTDPISIRMQIGPICRLKMKMEEYKEKSENMFANRAEYSYSLEDGFLSIEDLGGHKSVTNDIDFILKEIASTNEVDLSLYRIMYKDSEKIWDGIGYNGKEVKFYSINERDYYAAKIKCLNYK